MIEVSNQETKQPIIFQKYSMDKTPYDCLEYAEKYNGICGEEKW